MLCKPATTDTGLAPSTGTQEPRCPRAAINSLPTRAPATPAPAAAAPARALTWLRLLGALPRVGGAPGLPLPLRPGAVHGARAAFKPPPPLRDVTASGRPDWLGLGGRRPGRWRREAGPSQRPPRARGFPRLRGAASPRPPWASPAASLRPEDKARVCSSGVRVWVFQAHGAP